MKLTFSIINKYLRKYKMILYFILIIFLLLIFYNFTVTTFYEGMTTLSINDYEYLAPIPSNNSWSEETINQFTSKYLSVFPGVTSVNTKDYEPMALEAEAQYYIENGMFPLDTYVKNYLSQNTNFNGDKYNPTLIAQIYPNRFVYQQIIEPKEKELSPQPLSYQIFMGTAQQQNISSPTSSSSPSLLNLMNTSLNGKSYEQLVSLCKNVIGNN